LNSDRANEASDFEVAEQWLSYVEVLISKDRITDAIVALERLALEFPENQKVLERLEKVRLMNQKHKA
jgi:hypothetical protein